MRWNPFILILWISVLPLTAQELRPEIRENARLIEIRKELDYADALMKKGIFRDDDTGKDYFTGYAL